MRTKTLLLTAAIGLAGVTATLAQDGNVYSVNAVGYVNLELKDGLNLVANPLINQEGNNLTDLFGGLPNFTLVFRWEGEGFGNPSTLIGGAFNPDFELLPGEAVFVQVAGDQTVTCVGEVPQGQLSNPLPAGISFRSSIVPQDIDLDDPDIGFPAEMFDLVFTWDVDNQVYNSQSTFIASWNPPVQVGVGEGFVVQKSNAASWDREFSVNTTP